MRGQREEAASARTPKTGALRSRGSQSESQCFLGCKSRCAGVGSDIGKGLSFGKRRAAFPLGIRAL